MEYSVVRSELAQFIYDHSDITLYQKGRAYNYLLVGLYKTLILDYISKYDDIETIQFVFLNDVINRIPKSNPEKNRNY